MAACYCRSDFSTVSESTVSRSRDFSANTYDRKKKAPIPRQYALFHLLQVQPVFDRQRSHIKNNGDIERVELIPFGENGPAMSRNSYLTSLVFVRTDLCSRIIAEGITGSWWQVAEEYQFILQ